MNDSIWAKSLSCTKEIHTKLEKFQLQECTNACIYAYFCPRKICSAFTGARMGTYCSILELRISDGSVKYSISHRWVMIIVFDLICNMIFLLSTNLCERNMEKDKSTLHPISLLMLTVIPEEISPAYFYLFAASCLTSSSIQSLLNRSFESTIRKIL